MRATPVRVSPDWLRLREPADAAARSVDLAAAVRPAAGDGRVRVVHDLGSGDGSMGRWLSPLLDGPQHWVLHDLDPDLLHRAASCPPAPGAGGPSVTLETRLGDITRLRPADLSGACLVTASAVLDLLTGEELSALVRSCVRTRAPALLTLSVTGRVSLAPADPLDFPLRLAFNDHQQRATGRGDLRGPDAGRVAVSLFHDLGYRVRTRPSPWHLHAGHPRLARDWLRGWVAAAVEQRPGLSAAAQEYLARRLGQVEAGRLRVTVGHLDLLASPGGATR